MSSEPEKVVTTEQQQQQQEEEYEVEISESGSDTSSSDLIEYKPSWLSVLRFSAVNLFFPFINGMMLGFGEIFANELGIRWGWIGAYNHPIRQRIDRDLIIQRQRLKQKKEES
ncbi:outer membrane protein TOM13-domain-containing protein [Lipomyces japonicus]|uniref:outer membrane protein TOM13-domain-containing protein n=1 Tax=Lipomyces japonicus TaxID=56871 RepID=UPI0034CFA2CF